MNKIFKEKKTIKGEIEKSVQEGITLNYSSLAKRVGISVYRARKYCESRNIDLSNLQHPFIVPNKVQDTKPTKSRNKKLKVEVKNIKIDLKPTEINKIVI